MEHKRMNIVEGDLIQLAMMGEFEVIVHGCNCQCTMGAGIARTIKQRFPEAYDADRATAKGLRDKLGTISFARIARPGAGFVIVNAYTQFHWQGAGVKADYEAIRNAMAAVKTHFSGSRIGYPLIGAGLAGGDWNIIAPLIDEALAGEDHTLVRYVP
jgi:O-acetyl-ADP-ribose deacetylase (regulator of RNase III)